MFFLAYQTGSHDDFLLLGQRLKQHSSKSYRRARPRYFWLLAFISRPQVRNIHLPGQMILPGSLIPLDKYFLKNLTFVIRNPLVWLHHHSSQTLYVAWVKSKQLKSNVLPGLLVFLVVCSSSWPRKEFDWNGDIATRVACVPQRLR